MSAKTCLEVIVIGAGIGGLAAAIALRQAGHRVAVLEQSREFKEVGAGMQLVPNATRALRRLGVLDARRLAAVAPRATIRRRWEDGSLLGSFPLGEPVEERYQAPYWNAHRAEVHGALLEKACDPAGPGFAVRMQGGVRIRGVEPLAVGAMVVDDQGRTWKADLLVGADGIHSALRAALLGNDSPRYSGDDAYRALIDVEAIRQRPGAASLVAEPEVSIWLGPQRHAIHYWVRNRTLLNVVVLVPGDGSTRESWSSEGDRQTLLGELQGWDPRLVELAGCASRVGRWSLYDREPLSRWVWDAICLLGDACHPMLPYQSQGAAQALEDAVVLGDCLTDLDGLEQLPEALRAYQQRRMARSTQIQTASFGNRAVFHLPDGAEQQARDAELKTRGADFKAYDWSWSDACQP